MRKFAFISAVAGGLLAASQALAGPIFLTGHDPDFHAQPGAGAGGVLLSTGLNYATSGNAFDPTRKFLWVESNIPIPGGHLRGENGLTAIGLNNSHYDTVDGAGFTALSNAQLAAYEAIAIASSFGGLLTRAELDALNNRSADIATFINAGGGLFASSECYPCGANLLQNANGLFGFLPVTVTSIGANPPFTVTAFGAGLGLTNADMNDPTHNSFGQVGGLNVVDTDRLGNATTLAGIVNVGGGGFTPVPEPVALALFGIALASLGFTTRWRKTH